jgi:hypothetical protein
MARPLGVSPCWKTLHSKTDPHLKLKPLSSRYRRAPMKSHHLFHILWPSFLVASIIEGVVFTFFDPLEIAWQLNDGDISRQAIYSLGFFFIWGAVSLACALSLYLAQTPEASEWRWHPRR